MTRLTEVFSGITEIFLLGGEPLLHPQMAEFIDITRESFPKSRINVMTNGLLVPKMPSEFWESMRRNDAWLLCDDYPVGVAKQKIEAIVEREDVKIEWTDPRGEFFKLPIDLAGEQDPADSFRKCRGVMNCPVLRDGRIYPCAYAAFIDIFERKFEVEGIGAGEKDSVSIEADPYDVMEFLLNPIPWCSHCDFDNKENYTWGHSNGTMDEWLPESRVCSDE
jgi:ABC-2 type transport system ATP-binding protein